MRPATALLLGVLLGALTACGGGGDSKSAPGEGSWVIQGRILGEGDVSGIEVALTGDAATAAFTDAGGAFRFANVVNGVYRVTPVDGGYDFTPDYYDIVIAGEQPRAVTFQRGPLTDAQAPMETVRLVLVHHETGEALLDPYRGNLGENLANQNYYARNVTYGWDAPENPAIGDAIDIGQYWTWFADTSVQGNGVATRDNITGALYVTDAKTGAYPTPLPDPGGENEVIVLMSPFGNSGLNEDDASTVEALQGRPHTDPSHTVANCRGIYGQLLDYFRSRPDKLFVIVTAAPLADAVTSPEAAARARLLHDWMVFHWLQDAGWENRNVYVWDLFNVLTDEDNHHRYHLGQVVHEQVGLSDVAAYPTSVVDSTPDRDGSFKATSELLGMLNIFYNRWHHWRTTP